MKDVLRQKIEEILSKLDITSHSFVVEYTEDPAHGDFATNVALVVAKAQGLSPRVLAEKILTKLQMNLPDEVLKVEIAGPGFINFFLKDSVFVDQVLKCKAQGISKGSLLNGKKVIFEYTDPNPFKAFHIGHLMANAVGESLSRLAEFQGADVKRVCYQGDIGLHVAKTVWAMKKAKASFPHDGDTEDDKIRFMGDAYVFGVNMYEEDEQVKEEIKEINKKLFEKSDADLQVYYDKGREWSLKYFDRIYKKLDTRFDSHVFESEVSDEAVKIVRRHIPDVFEESDGAIVFKGEKYGLHTRVFLNSQGLPTYEAKELANTLEKIKRYSPDVSIVTSANEITDYFKVIKCVLGLIDPKSGESLEFISHGMLRLTEGKMSSRKGNIVTGESLIMDTETEVLAKMQEREMSEEEKKEIATKVAIGAIKYAILKQSPGKDIIFDKEKALSFEGDSGPYLLYTLVRAKAVLKKAEDLNIKKEITETKCFGIEKELVKFKDIAKRAFEEKAPQKVVEYLTKLSAEFNSFYAKEKIADNDDVYSPYKIAVVECVVATLQKGVWLLGIQEVERM